MSKFNDMISNIDSGVNPSTGNLLRKIFKIITLILVIVVMPAIALAIGSVACMGGVELASWVLYVGFIPWFVLVVIFGLLWFYFSKWTEE